MLFMTDTESAAWRSATDLAAAKNLGPDDINVETRSNLWTAMCFYVGATLTARGNGDLGMAWLSAGAMREEQGVFTNAYLTAFLSRHENRLAMPVVCFADPRPYVHFTTVPAMVTARTNLVKHFVDTLPRFTKPFRMMDIGCGDGSLTAWLLRDLRDAGKIGDISEILLVDSSQAMLDLARVTLEKEHPANVIHTLTKRIEETTEQPGTHFDVAVASLAYHHMPLETKRRRLTALKPAIDHYFLFELNGNHDAPEAQSPELAFSLYQTYGRMMDFVFAHDAPVDVVLTCIDNFWMTELVSFLTQPRGVRTDYHMLRSEWMALFEETLTPEFSRLSDSTCWGDEYLELFSMHYGRK